MRTFYLILSFVCLCDLLHAQTVRIAYEGDPLTDKERQKIELTLQYEVEFYSQFGLPDTLNLKLTVFNKREDALVYLNKFNIHPPKSTNGIYISRLQKAIILSREKEYQQGLGVIYHELSHHLTLQITAGRPPIWLNEGLAEYFEHCKVNKKGLQHTFTEYEKGRIRTIYMLGDIDLPTFINSRQNEFMKQQRTDEQYAYILSHALVTFWIEKAPRQIFRDFVLSLQNKDDSSTVSELIEQIYTGGFKQFEKDFEAFCK